MINFGFKASLLAVVLSSVSVAPVEAITAQGVGKAVGYTAAGVAITWGALVAALLNKIIKVEVTKVFTGDDSDDDDDDDDVESCSSFKYKYETLLHPAIAHPRKMLLRKAILDGHVGLAKLVLAAGVDASAIPFIDADNDLLWAGLSISALGMAVMLEDTKMIKMLLDAGADVNQVLMIPLAEFPCYLQYRTALSCAVISDSARLEIVKMLLDAGAKLDTGILYDGKSTLIDLAKNDEIRALLIAKKAEQEAAAGVIA